MIAKFSFAALIALAFPAAPAFAIEQNCRFIPAKPDREACYKRQEDELAARRRPEPRRENIALESLREMRQDDEAVYRSINNICRGC